MEKQTFFHFNNETLSDNKRPYYQIKLSFSVTKKNKVQTIYASFLIPSPY